MQADRTIANRSTGETLTMLVSEEENNGARQLYQVLLPPNRPSPPLHYHTRFTETFSVLEGALDVYIGRERRHIVLKQRQSVTVQIRQPHTFANERDQSALITVETIPAGGVVKAFQLAYGIANDGGAAKDGLPRNPLMRLVVIRISEGYLPNIPLTLQKSAFALAGLAARVTRLNRQVAKYLNDA